MEEKEAKKKEKEKKKKKKHEKEEKEKKKKEEKEEEGEGEKEKKKKKGGGGGGGGERGEEVLNKYVHNLGMDEHWNFVDVYGLDTELLAMVPRPVAAVMLLFPSSKGLEPLGEVQTDYPKDLFYTKQTIGNACGTVAIVHALANNQKQITFDESKHFKTFLEMTQAMNAEDKAKYLEKDEQMGAAHEDCAQEGDTQAPSVDEHVKSHFVTFVNCNGNLYELDGRKDGPVFHGQTNADSFLEDAVDVVKKFIARDPDNVNFNVMALVHGSE
ncbi:ubiquitin carboxyl-terminal hydrolase [Plakobranchus ocellatus]|uniref:Ubiquitin carboxyl-terminal hydrolase n=1 Tax=Plakobranchus ocellatus TaxID=259542 RepID=A0AAV3ZK01_9GAST|nr:ubiquitin carboxyl-terminal hydrolase [Plakobranchus ocellatus]